MNDKEFNLAILGKLYEIAATVWAKMAKNDFGTYTAAQINKGLNKYFWWADVDIYESNTITEGNFTCTFPTERIWQYVSVFEKLAAVGNNTKQFVHEEVGDIVGSCTFLLNKGANELCKFVANDKLRPSLGMVCLSPKYHCLVASDGFKMLSYPIEITEFNGNMDDFMIDTKLFAKMCKGMTKGGEYIVTATKEKKGIREYCKLSFNGITSCIDNYILSRYARWNDVIPEVSDWNSIILKRGNIDALKEIQKFIGRDKKAVVYLDGKKGDLTIKASIGDNVKNISVGSYITFDFKIAFSANVLLAADNIEKLYLGCKASMPLVASNEYNSIYVLMPLIREDNYGNRVYYENGKFNPSASDYAGYDTTLLCENTFRSLLDIRTKGANDRLQALETTKEVSNTTEQESEPQAAANVVKTETAKEIVTENHRINIYAGGIVISSNYRKRDNDPEPTKAEVTKPVTTTKAAATTKEQRKFTFEKVGIKPGDVLTFVDGTEVIATADNKVEFCGEVFTLSGFTKQFTPNPTKSGAYRGCDWFYKDGVKLSKLFKQYLDGLGEPSEEVTTEQQEVIPKCKDVTLDSEQKEYIEPWEQRFNDVWLGQHGCEIVRASVKYFLTHTIYVCVNGKARMLQVIRLNVETDDYLVSIVGSNYSYIEDRKTFTDFYHEYYITKERYEVLVGLREHPRNIYPECYIDTTTEQPQKSICVPLEVESEVITPPSKENVSGAKETTSLQLDVGTLAKVVSITLGVPIEYGTPPPRYGGGAKVVNHSFAYDVGDYSLTAGKVVHELPLPPPKQRR